MHNPPDLSVIIVNWNSAAFVRKCLQSLASQIEELGAEIIVIDNASGDRCGEMIKAEFPAVRFLQSSWNRGFARANNLAFQNSSGRLLLFLNPDTEVSEDAIRRLMEVFEVKPDAGIAGARLLNSDGSIQRSCIQRFPSILGVLLDSDLLRTLFPRWTLWGMRPLFDDPPGPVAVEAVSGACQMVRRDVFQRAGLYDAAYFMYTEDVDLCWRTARLGLRNYYVPDAVLTHHGGKSSGQMADSGRSAVIMRESWRCFFLQHRSRAYAQTYRIAVGLQAVLRLLLIVPSATVAGLLGRRARIHIMLRKWTSILRWSVGLESWVRALSAN